MLLGDETFGGGIFPYLYEEAGGWVFSPKQLPQERRSWKDDLYDYRNETIDCSFPPSGAITTETFIKKKNRRSE
jgi:hypothetical protein